MAKKTKTNAKVLTESIGPDQGERALRNRSRPYSFGGSYGFPESMQLFMFAQRVVWPTPPLIGAEDVGQRNNYTTRARVE